ncbi:MAG TPA: ABC transporter ATP-binding protein, partial [Solirubrobacterales bacterium]|nr:ABC transporter ATP-binding protein [Solirubrobacterales bacterium]
LDVESREALEDALSAFEGAVILVSHDRALLEAIGTRTLALEDGTLRSHPVGWAEYQRQRDEEEAVTAAALQRAKAARPKSRQHGRRESQRAARKASRLAEKIEQAEAELREIEDDLADPAAWASPGRAQRANERHAAAKRAVEELYAEWEAAEAQVSAAAE